MASMYDAFNGPDHDQDPVAKGYIGDDGEHCSDAGKAAQVDVLDALGYAAGQRVARLQRRLPAEGTPGEGRGGNPAYGCRVTMRSGKTDLGDAVALQAGVMGDSGGLEPGELDETQVYARDDLRVDEAVLPGPTWLRSNVPCRSNDPSPRTSCALQRRHPRRHGPGAARVPSPPAPSSCSSLLAH
jgi:hypothetical protein